MFNYFSKEKRIEFHSNPPMDETYVLKSVLDSDTGNIKPVLACVPQNHHSELEGCHFSEATMSLRAKLNLGIPLKQVAMPSLDNDPAVSLSKIASVERSISDKIQNLENQQQSALVPEPAN